MARGLERKAAQTRVKRSTLSPPPEFVGDPIVWAAWLYYEERMTQEEVADRRHRRAASPQHGGGDDDEQGERGRYHTTSVR